MTVPRHILVTGGAGFIGSCFVGMCVGQGWRVTVLDALTYAGHAANLSWIEPGARGGSYELIKGDVRDGELVSRLLRERSVDAVFHFAAESHVDNSITGPAAFIETNIVGTYRLLEACRAYWNELSDARKSFFRYLQISTDEVYGSLGETGRFSEQSPYHPNSPYSASKAAGDHLARAWQHTYGLPVIVTHCTNNYGPRQHPEKLIPRMIACALAGEKLPVYGKGENVRDWIHVEDHCSGVLLALEKGKVGESYDFGGNAEWRNIDLVRLVCALLDVRHPRADGKGYSEQIVFVADRLGHDMRYAMSTAKSERMLDFVPMYDFRQGLAATVEWYLAHQDWCALMAEQAA
jgi:dTDP-glucose 4,6-dehydratase